MTDPLRVGVFGAGAIGAHVGLRLAAVGAEVTLLGRASLVEAEAAGRLAARGLAGPVVPAGPRLKVSAEVGELGECDLIAICVKSRDTRAAGEQLCAALGRERLAAITLVSLQNGLQNVARLAELGLEARAGMVSFNVHRLDSGVYQQATSGPIMVAARPRDARLERFGELCQAAGVEFELRPDMRAVQTGKLLLNLNNAICTLAGVSIAESLRSRDLRRCFAASMREALDIYAAAGERPARIGKLPPRLISRLLPLPDAIVLRVAKSLITIDPAARSSTLQDLERGKPTEIDDLNGALVELAESAGVACPVNRWIVEQVHRLEQMDELVFLEPGHMWRAIRARVGA